MISIDGIMIAKCVPAKIIYTFMPFQPSCQREYAFRRTGFGDDGHIGKYAGSPSEEPGKPQSDIRISDGLFAKFELQLRFPEIEYVVNFLNLKIHLFLQLSLPVHVASSPIAVYDLPILIHYFSVICSLSADFYCLSRM